MTVTIRELMESRSANNLESGQILAFRSFLVHGDSSTPVNTGAQALAELEAADSSVIANPPRPSEPYPEDPNLRAITWRVDRHLDSDGNGAWLVQWTYTSPIAGSIEPGEVLATRISVQPEPFFIDAWRTGGNLPTIAADGTYPGLATSRADMGGTPIDAAGEPVSTLVRRVTIEISLTMRPPIPLRNITFLTGKRNANALGISGAYFPAGMLLYTGAAIDQQDDEKFQVTHRFVADEQNHLRQQTRREADGRPAIDELVAADTNWKATTVFWVQPFAETADFGILRL